MQKDQSGDVSKNDKNYLEKILICFDKRLY